MRVLIFAVNFFKRPYSVYPLGAAAAAEVARRAGHETLFVDLMSQGGFSGYDQEKLVQVVNNFAPDAIGLSVRNIESTDSFDPLDILDFSYVRRIVLDLRAVTSVPLFMGGAGFSLLPCQILEQSGVDYGLIGEAENSLPIFLKALEEGQVPKKCQPQSKSLATTQVSAYDRDLVLQYASRGHLIGVQTKRGCPFKCLYCSYPLLEGSKIRPRPITQVMEDLIQLADIMGQGHIAFADGLFNDPDGHWRELLNALASAHLPLKWTAFFQPTPFKKGDLELIQASGVSGLEFGTDASNDAALLALGKPFDFATVLEVQKKCAAANIPTAHFVVFGGPGETSATVEAGLKNLDKLPNCVVFVSTGWSIYPRTGLYNLALNQGQISGPDNLKSPVFYYAPEIDPIQLNCNLTKTLSHRRDRLFPSSIAWEKTEIMRRLGFSGPLWDTLITKDDSRNFRRYHA